VQATPEHADRATPVGDTTGGTMGVAKYLRDQGHAVTLFGQVRGDPPGVRVVRPNVRGMDEYSTVADVEARYRAATDELGPQDACLNVAGPSPTTSWVGNPYGASTQQCYMKYTGPLLYAMHHLGLKRVLLVHDPRNYPRDHEMLYWPECRPAVVLSLEERSFPRRLRHQQYIVHAQYGRGENWWSYGTPYHPCDEVGRDVPCLMVQHSHLEDDRLSDGRADAYATFMGGDEVDVLVGRGWDKYPGGAPRAWQGEVSPGECRRLLQRALCGPIVPIADKFITSKLRQYALNGCLPLPYGRGERFTYDHLGRYVPLDAEIRVQTRAELRELVDRARRDEGWRRGWVERIREATEPDFSVLEEALTNPGKFGGYEPCESRP